MDGRLFVKTTDSNFDVVIVNLPDPRNAQLNRFYTVEFFREVSRRLSPTGLLSFQLSSSENYISPELAQFLRSIYRSLREVFPEVTTIPGETVHFFAARQKGVLAANAKELVDRLHARHLATSYVSEYFIPFRMMPDRQIDFNGPDNAAQSRFCASGLLLRYRAVEQPVQSEVRTGVSRIGGSSFWLVGGGELGIALAGMVVVGRGRGLAAGFCTASTGFTMIGLELMLLLAFQAVYGYVYQELALILAAFMAGMALGSWVSIRCASRGGMRVLAWQPGVDCFWLRMLLLCGTAFPAMALVFGMLGGFEFPLASRLKPARPGTLYALDLAGSSVGAILFSLWLVPVFGFFKTALLLAMVSLAPAAMAILEAE